MKRTCTFFLFLLPFLIKAQSIDTIKLINEIDSLITVSKDRIKKRDYDKALIINNVAKEKALSVFGKRDTLYADCLFNEGGIYQRTRQMSKAEELYNETLSIREVAFGDDHLECASVLNHLGILYRRTGKYENAKQAYLRAKKIRGKQLGKDDRRYAVVLNNLGIAYLQMGQFEESEENLLEVKRIRKTIYGTDHPLYAEIISNLAVLFVEGQRYEEAEKYLVEAKAIQDKKLGKESEDYAKSLGNLGILYRYLGQYEESEKCYLEAIEILEKVIGTDHPYYATNLDNLGALYFHMGLFKEAEPLYQKSKTVREKTLEKDHPDYSSSLNNLGILYHKTGNQDSTEICLKEAKDIREKIGGKENPDYANTLEDLAIFYSETGKNEEALKLQLEAEKIYKKALGEKHPRYAQCLKYLAEFYLNLRQFDSAEPLIIHANTIQKEILTNASRHLSERELSAHTQLFSEDLNLLYSLCQTNNTAQNSLVNTAFDNALFHKGFLLMASQQVKSLALSDSSSTKQFERLIAFHRRLSDEYVASQVDQKKIMELEKKVNILEKTITRNVAGFGEALRQVNWEEVKAKLKPEEAAIEFVHYNFLKPQRTDSIMYAALIIRPDLEEPKFIPLFEEKSLDSLLNIHTQRESAYANSLYDILDRGVVPVSQSTKTLYQLIWEPIEKELPAIKTVLYSPTGLLHRINLSAISLEFQVTVADRFKMVQKASLRELVIPAQLTINNNDALLYGGLTYNFDSTGFFGSNEELTTQYLATRGSSQLKLSDNNTATRRQAFRQLLHSDQEVTRLTNFLDSHGFIPVIRKGFMGTEDFLKTVGAGISSPRILHLATHGYFFEDPPLKTEKVLTKPLMAKAVENELVFKISDQPMVRAGLILSGGNYAWQGNDPIPGIEDGIFTAYEFSQMNLTNTELVVLSACETGLGDIKGNEGIYGLQRAAKIAGAKYLIMSLWQVPDAQTKKLMTIFYSKWLEEKMTIPDAFRSAQEELREMYEIPYFWAGFVLLE
ncbi:MAG: CHAT domain-containing protein [Saprospiraceae bacterium]|jgi:CHAT domain-containing protein|nr:CHAT domain-containing protein [Saprospiraceae bacterium]